MTPLLEVEDLRVAFRRGRRSFVAVNGISFELAEAETLAIVGESGSGKSVTALSLLRLLPTPPAVVSGTVRFEGRDVLELSEKELRRVRGGRIAMIFQDALSSLNPVRTIGAQMEETIRLHLGLASRAARERAIEYLGQVGIPAPVRQLGAYPHQFSGGMRQRVMIAMALSCEPRVLVADEPTTALDVSVQAQILELLRTVTERFGTSLIMISHDLSVVAGLADRVAVMYSGEIVENGATERVFAHPRHPYTIGLLECVPRLDEERRDLLPSIPGSPPDITAERHGCSFAPRCSFVLERCAADRPVLEEKEQSHVAACWADLAEPPAPTPVVEAPPRPAEPPAADPAPLLELRDVRVHFPVGHSIPLRRRAVVRAADGVSFSVGRGETLGLVGESGSGKTTVARTIVQLERLAGGAVIFRGQELNALPARDLRRVRPHMQMVFQDPYSSLNARMTAGATVAEPLLVHDVLPRREVRDRVHDLLAHVGLDRRHAYRYPHELSGGQRQRVSIARALALNPALIVADEPTSALDVSVRAQILNLLQRLQEEERLAYVLISHDLSVVRHMSNRIAVMYLGRIVELADRDTLYANPQHPYTRALLSMVPIPDPALEKKRRRLPISGEIPSALDPPSGCSFHTRCPLAFDRCSVDTPTLDDLGGGHLAACFLAQSEPPAGGVSPDGAAAQSDLMRQEGVT